MTDVKRGNKSDTVLIRDDGVDIEVPTMRILKNSKFKPIGLIRIAAEELESLGDTPEYLTVFNLQVSNHVPEENYILPRIVKHGHYDENGKEVKPVLDFNNCFAAECLSVRENVAYVDLKEDDFKNSFENIKNADDLKKSIIRRYSTSMPDLGFDEILEMGVSVTNLKILGKDFH